MKNREFPKDWENTAMIFGRALSGVLNEGEGIIVDLDEDIFFEADERVKKIIVYLKDDQICITECKKNLEEGTIVIVHNINLN
jgi:hypothetical protein